MATQSTSTRGESRDPLHLQLGAAQVTLFLVFAMTGFVKLTLPIAVLAPLMGWVMNTPPALVRFIGVAELAGAFGVLLPGVTRVRPWLTPLAALGLTLVMLLATAVNLTRGEAAHAAVSLTLGGLAAFVAWGRSGRRRITRSTARRSDPQRRVA